jgi:hypothetical protein
MSGGIGLALVVLLATPAIPLHATQEPERAKEKEKEKGKEMERKGNPLPGGKGRPEPVPMRPGPAPRPGPMAHPEPMAHPAPGMPGRDLHPMNVVRTRDGGEIHRGPGGVVREVHTPGGAVVHFAPDGMRHVEVVRPDGRVFFANGGGHGGYIQRPFMVHNQAFVQRTYVEHGVSFTRVYRPYAYHGLTFNVYVPTHYYRPGFYTWAYQPWGHPVAYRWGWGGQPWYGYYGGYYTPYAVYPGPVFWLTDFLVATTLQSAYQSRMDNAVAAPPPPPGGYDPNGMTPDVKQAIAEEVRRQVDQERSEQQAMAQGYAAPAGAPPLFSNNVSRIFLVSNSTLAYARGQEHFLSEGDVLQLNGPPMPNATTADVVLMASRNRSLPRGSVVTVNLMDLQDMQNHMRATIDQGLGDLQSRQGQDGLPPMAAQNLGSSDAPFASGIQPDANAAGELSQVAMDANTASQGMLSQNPTAPAPAPASGGSIALGMSAGQVHDILGNPKQTANIGAKTIEVYPSFKVTYLNGSVTDIQ